MLTGTTNYTLHGKNIVHMTQGGNTLHFFYDANNKPAIVEFNGTKYAYVHNLQGDIVAILDSNGTAVVQYKYDAWGKPISKTGSMKDSLGKLNPFRYRGYVYDEETELYYLRSRYYHPLHTRFVCGDSIVALNELLNMSSYCYCKNAPVSYQDVNGTLGKRLILLTMQDEFAKELVDHWIDGGGNELIIKNNDRWDAYMLANPQIDKRIRDMTKTALQEGTDSFSYVNGKIVLSEDGDGGYFTGYDLLNGSNYFKGGFDCCGNIEIVGNNQYIVTGTFAFHDRMDVNEKFPTDIFWNNVVHWLIGNDRGIDYDVHIYCDYMLYIEYEE